ncbi:MAG: hypothetical protein K0S53_429 [Bacteroidetes bacterium]|jgi:hypothetical protein|nr:hypothetical protein [Bacteroidota bacterium]
MDDLQEKLLERLTLLKRQIKKMYPELSERLKEGPLVDDRKKKKDDHSNKE